VAIALSIMSINARTMYFSRSQVIISLKDVVSSTEVRETAKQPNSIGEKRFL
jgi:hypothetical protein